MVPSWLSVGCFALISSLAYMSIFTLSNSNHMISIHTYKEMRAKLHENYNERVPVTIVTGVGRCGTSLLMALLTDLHLATGFNSNDVNDFKRNEISGFEKRDGDIFYAFDHPYKFREVSIYKSPYLIQERYLGQTINRCAAYELCEFVLLVRNTSETALSRYRNTLKGERKGRLTEATIERQKQFDDGVVSAALTSFSENDLKVSILSYPRLTHDSEYVFRKLRALFLRYNISQELVHDHMQDFILSHRNKVLRSKENDQHRNKKYITSSSTSYKIS
jgi:hypothetical protein